MAAGQARPGWARATGPQARPPYDQGAAVRPGAAVGLLSSKRQSNTTITNDRGV